MGLIVDSSVLIAGERRGESVRQIITRLQRSLGNVECALSAMSIIELTHGIYRARTDADRIRRKTFAEELARDMVVQPLNLAIAQLAGRIEGEQAAIGNVIAIQDLIIGATALHIGFEVVTANVRHFQSIPRLKVLSI